MSDINMERVSALWEDTPEACREEFETGVIRMSALDGAYKAMHKEPFALGDGFRDLEPRVFWEKILRNGEIHLAKDEAGFVAMHIITSIQYQMWAVWEVFTPPKRRTSPKGLKSAEMVINYCFSPSGLNVRKIKALTHPENLGAIHYLKHLGFQQRGVLPNEASFNGEPHTMILWELDNPVTRIDQLEPQAIGESDDWDTASDGADSGRSESDGGLGGSDADGYESVPEPWQLLKRVDDSQRSMAGAANGRSANAGGNPGRKSAPRESAYYWES